MEYSVTVKGTELLWRFFEENEAGAAESVSLWGNKTICTDWDTRVLD